MAEGFQADATELWKAAYQHLEGLAGDMDESLAKLRKVDEDIDLFRGGGDVFRSIEPYWSDTRYYLERVLADNKENVHLAAQALMQIAQRYDADDKEIADWLRGHGQP
ncbi:hypothetical protein [Saccharopolyspora rosea]|uniref:Excreted virulence factor EspC, type VII ESX diderm n=1 Tax=Saccharopolyspora rosea TaxID=524884 RepID=A0ABW3FUE6_9PSEU|nr:hypothetical protein [Saccharopolyspora rosea]